jgi:hypothetical protein
MRPILLLILSALALPALSQAAVRVEVLETGWPNGHGLSADDQGILITLRGGELKRWQPGRSVGADSRRAAGWANGRVAYWTWRWPGFRPVAAGVAELCGKRRQR